MAASSGATQGVWVKVKGGASCIRVATEGLLNVAMLIEKVKEEVNPLFDNVPLPNINLYRSEQVKNDGGEALNPVMDIPENNKDDQNMPIPLYVDYPDVPVTTWLKDGCFAMMRACSGDMAVLCRCFVLFCTIAAYVIITVNCYDDATHFGVSISVCSLDFDIQYKGEIMACALAWHQQKPEIGAMRPRSKPVVLDLLRGSGGDALGVLSCYHLQGRSGGAKSFPHARKAEEKREQEEPQLQEEEKPGKG
ncbi:unnamed protein product [Effrenium voratum]|nr:unnamed protein product [Effrenium voratum]